DRVLSRGQAALDLADAGRAPERGPELESGRRRGRRPAVPVGPRLTTLDQDQAEVGSLADHSLHAETAVRRRGVQVGEIHRGSEPRLVSGPAGPAPESGWQARALVPVALVHEGIGRDIEGG